MSMIAVLPNALAVRIDPDFAAPSRPDRPDMVNAVRTPEQGLCCPACADLGALIAGDQLEEAASDADRELLKARADRGRYVGRLTP